MVATDPPHGHSYHLRGELGHLTMTERTDPDLSCCAAGSGDLVPPPPNIFSSVEIATHSCFGSWKGAGGNRVAQFCCAVGKITPDKLCPVWSKACLLRNRSCRALFSTVPKNFGSLLKEMEKVLSKTRDGTRCQANTSVVICGRNYYYDHTIIY